MNKKILQLALPSIVSNITVPLLGLVDVAIVGHLGAASYIGAIAVGGMLFNIIYWLFGFLRMGTSGMTSQALGRRDLLEVTRVLFRSVGVGILISLALLLLQYPIREIAFLLLDTGAEAEPEKSESRHRPTGIRPSLLPGDPVSPKLAKSSHSFPSARNRTTSK